MTDLEDAAWVIYQIRELLGADLWEEQKCQTIYAFHKGIPEEDYLAVWDLLKDEPATRRAWQEYVRQGWHREQQERHP